MKLNSKFIMTVAIVASAAAAAAAHNDDAHEEHNHNDHNEHNTHDMKNMTNLNNTEMEPSPEPMNGPHHHHGLPILENTHLEPQQRAYWEQYNTTTFLTAKSPAKGFLWMHVILNLSGWIFLFPIALMLSVENSPLYLPIQTLQSATNLISLVALGIYGATAPQDLYPNNIYSKFSFGLFFVVVAHWFAVVIRTLANWAISSAQLKPIDGADYILTSSNDTAANRSSQDSGHGIASPTNTSNQFTEAGLQQDIMNNNSHEESDEDLEFKCEDFDNESMSHPLSFESTVQDRYISRIMQNQKIAQVVEKLGAMADIIFTLLNRPMFFIGFAYLLIGVATATCMAKDKKVFNILAHFIKGGVFFLYGILTLARYFGCFADVGMAWNVKPENSNRRYPFSVKRAATGLKQNVLSRFLSFIASQFKTMESVECSLIFFYGITNVFMEHLGNDDGAWSHKDLQHASIAFMYIGGGLCGLLVESETIKQILAKSLFNNGQKDQQINIVNPFPAFIVFWTGVLMSKHAQALPLSTEIHSQWGVLLCVAAMFRIATYVLLFITPIQSTQPSRPFTELITSFCLICGGMVFIQSNGETVEAMIYRGLDSMFTLNVNVGITALIMAWEMLVMVIKGLAHRRKA